MNKLFRFKILLLVFMISLATTFAIPFYTYATEIDSDSMVNPMGAGEWDFKGQQSPTLGAGVAWLTNEYVATDGGNFKIDMQSTFYSSNYVHTTYFVNGVKKFTLLNSIDDYKGTVQIGNLNAGDRVQFSILVDKGDKFTYSFYD